MGLVTLQQGEGKRSKYPSPNPQHSADDEGVRPEQVSKSEGKKEGSQLLCWMNFIWEKPARLRAAKWKWGFSLRATDTAESTQLQLNTPLEPDAAYSLR